jgi:hypothetical protein
MAAPELTDELPELETAALEELSAEAMAPVGGGASASNPFGDLGALPDEPVAAAPPPPPAPVAAAPPPPPAPVAAAPPPAASSQLSSKDLTDDILGGVDFDVPAQGAAGAPKATLAAPKPLAAPDAKPAAPFAFKPATPAFASGGPPKPGSPFGTSAAAAKPVIPVAVAPPAKPAPVPGQQDAKSLFGDIGNDLGDLSALGGEEAPKAPARSASDVLREALTSDAAPTQLPPDALKLAFSLCRLLIKKGVISVDELL